MVIGDTEDLVPVKGDPSVPVSRIPGELPEASVERLYAGRNRRFR